MAIVADYPLFTPFTLAKDVQLKNRIVLSPLTRARADRPSHNPNDLLVEYYAQRASAGLIIAEDTAVRPQGFRWYGAPGIYMQDHVAGWKKVTNAVHAKDGKIFLQLWHMGRQAHSYFNDGKQVVSSTATQLIEGRLRNSDGEYTTYEITGVVEDYRHAAELAKQAGFDGVEIHSANGYLIDQFLQSSFNKCTDKYGGSIENRARILLEIVDTIKTVWPSDRIACRVSPNGVFGRMGSPDNYETFMYIIEQLSKDNLEAAQKNIWRSEHMVCETRTRALDVFWTGKPF